MMTNINGVIVDVRFFQYLFFASDAHNNNHSGKNDHDQSQKY